MLEGQLSIFDYATKENKNEITTLQQVTIDKVLEKNTRCEVLLYKSGIVGVITDYDPKVITPQGDESKRFKPKWTKKTYLIDKEGIVLAIAVGEVRE